MMSNYDTTIQTLQALRDKTIELNDSSTEWGDKCRYLELQYKIQDVIKFVQGVTE